MRAVVIRTPAVRIVRGEPDCRCGSEREDGRHEPVEECGTLERGCTDPSAHHEYRPQPWWRRFRRPEWFE